MLVTFAIQSQAINNSATPSHVKRLLVNWERFGILTCPARSDRSIIARLHELNPRARKLWTVAWSSVAKNNGNRYRWIPTDESAFDWNNLVTADALTVPDEKFEVALLGDGQATILGIPDGESMCLGSVEGVRLWDIDASLRFGHCETLSAKPIEQGELREDIWTQRFQRLASHANVIVVVDQYAVQNNNIDGVISLLNFCDRDSEGCEITLYSSPGRNGSLHTIQNAIEAAFYRLNGNRIASVTVRLFRESDFRVYAHDRHIRFDQNVIRIGRGMRPFEKATVTESTDVGLAVLEPGESETKEDDLDKKATKILEFSLPVGQSN